MALLETNPTQLQHTSDNAIPLFLIHDGGGTIFKYLLLGDLGRNVYGIHDPKFECEDGWEGGMIEMAQEYLTFIKAMKKAGPIFLGGWSLGGLVSLQIARLIDDERQQRHVEHDTQLLCVAGVILIDSPYTSPKCEYRGPFLEFEPEFPTWTPEGVRKNIIRRFEVCDQLMNTWKPPLWNAYSDDSTEGSTMQATTSDSTIQRPATTGERLQVRPVLPSPPVVLLKATAHVPLTNSKSGGLLKIDMFRDNALLGWGLHTGDLLETVYHISGHHFNLLDHDDKVEAVTAIMKETCARWEDSYS